MSITVKVRKLHDDAVLPVFGTDLSAGADLVVTEVLPMKNNICTYKFGIAIEIPKNYMGLLFPRSSVYKTRMSMSNSVGVIDPDYRGEIMAKMRYSHKGDSPFIPQSAIYNVGDRAVQLVIVPRPTIIYKEVDRLSLTDRDAGGFGSTGVKYEKKS